MIMKKFFLALTTALMLFMLVPYVSASEGFYVGGSAGRTDADVDCPYEPGFVVTCDTTDTGWKIFGGYQFTPNWGVEAFYADLGDISMNGNRTYQGSPITVDVDFGIDGLGIAAIGIFPIGNKFDILGKLGLLHWNLKSSATITIGGNSIPLDDDDANGTDIMFGIGARYSFSERFAIRAEWERFDIDDDDIDLLSAGLVWSF